MVECGTNFMFGTKRLFWYQHLVLVPSVHFGIDMLFSHHLPVFVPVTCYGTNISRCPDNLARGSMGHVRYVESTGPPNTQIFPH